MKNTLSIALLLVVGAVALAQGHPAEWSRYTTDAYYYDIESAATKQAALD